MRDYITRNVVLEKKDENIVNDRVRREGLGLKGFSVALRLIIREWDEKMQEGSGSASTNQGEEGEKGEGDKQPK